MQGTRAKPLHASPPPPVAAEGSGHRAADPPRPPKAGPGSSSSSRGAAASGRFLPPSFSNLHPCRPPCHPLQQPLCPAPFYLDQGVPRSPLPGGPCPGGHSLRAQPLIPARHPHARPAQLATRSPAGEAWEARGRPTRLRSTAIRPSRQSRRLCRRRTRPGLGLPPGDLLRERPAAPASVPTRREVRSHRVRCAGLIFSLSGPAWKKAKPKPDVPKSLPAAMETRTAQ